MAHVVIAEEYDAVRQLLTVALEGERHQVTAPRDFWGVLAVLRSTLHPVVVVYDRDPPVRQLWRDEEHLAALEAARAELQRHRYIGISWDHARVTPRLLAIERALKVKPLLQPFPLGDLAAAVARAAEQLPQ